MGSLVRFFILTSLLLVASISAARKCPQEQFKEMTRGPQTQELIEGPAYLRFDEKIIKMPSSNSGGKDEFPKDFEPRPSASAYHGISKDFEPRPSASAYHGISKDFEPRPSASAYHDISKDFEPRSSVTAYHDNEESKEDDSKEEESSNKSQARHTFTIN